MAGLDQSVVFLRLVWVLPVDVLYSLAAHQTPDFLASLGLLWSTQDIEDEQLLALHPLHNPELHCITLYSAESDNLNSPHCTEFPIEKPTTKKNPNVAISGHYNGWPVQDSVFFLISGSSHVQSPEKLRSLMIR